MLRSATRASNALLHGLGDAWPAAASALRSASGNASHHRHSRAWPASAAPGAADDRGPAPRGPDDYREANAAAAAASSSGGGDGDDGAHTQRPLNPEQRRRALGSVLREAQLAEAGMSKFFAAQQLLLRGRPDAAYFAEQERRQLDAVQELMPRYRTRPSLLLTLAQAAGAGAGALAAAAPRRLWDAVVGGLQDALTEVYNEQLGELRRQGLSDDEPEVRRLVLALRDMERAPEGAPAPPDVLALQRAEALRGVGVAGVAGAVAKAAALVLLGAGKRL